MKKKTKQYLCNVVKEYIEILKRRVCSCCINEQLEHSLKDNISDSQNDENKNFEIEDLDSDEIGTSRHVNNLEDIEDNDFNAKILSTMNKNATIDNSEVPYVETREQFEDGSVPKLSYSNEPELENIDYIPKQVTKLTYEKLLDLKKNNKLKKEDSHHLEANLSDEDFVRVFQMSREEFYSQQRWKQIKQKKQLDLF